MTRYEIVEGGEAIKCLACGLTSHHPKDVEHRYCGKCHVFHNDEDLKDKLGVDRDFADGPTTFSSMAASLRVLRVTSRKPPLYNPKPWTDDPPGIEPLFATSYLRGTKVGGEYDG
jgi:hypothetical protein